MRTVHKASKGLLEEQCNVLHPQCMLCVAAVLLLKTRHFVDKLIGHVCSCAVFFAKVVADGFGRGLFEEYLHLACVPFVPEPMTSSTVGSVSNQLSVADVMATGVIALRPVILITDLIHILQSNCYQVRL